MRRLFTRPLFDHFDHFPSWGHFRRVREPFYQVRITIPEEELKSVVDANEVFNQFFKENGIKTETEKEFFKKHFPEEIKALEAEFDPYKVLEISIDATQDQIKEAYRTLALKYHPKNNTAADAEAKFKEVAKAYEQLAVKKVRDWEESGKSFFEEFEKKIEHVFRPKKNEKGEEAKGDKKEKKADDKEQDLGSLYSESSSFESINGQQTKLVIERAYRKNGKNFFVRRQQKLREDGKVEITETIDDGQNVKKKSFIQENEQTKKLQ